MRFTPYIYALSLLSFSASAAEPTAWSKTSWGMSVEQIRAAMSETVEIPDTPAVHFRLESGQFETAHIGVPSVTIDGIHLTAFFMTEPNGLHMVLLRPIDASPDEDTFHQLEAALSVKYGNPFSRSGQISVAQWKTKTSLIRLTYTNLKVGFRSLWIEYSPLPADDSN